MPLSAAYEAIVMNSLLSNTAFPSAATLYFGLSTQTVSGATDALLLAGEPAVTTGGYLRPSLTNNTTNWPTYTSTGSSPATKLLAAGPGPTGVISWPASTGSGWTTAATPLVTCLICTTSTPQAGTILWYGAVTAGAVNAAGILLSFSVNAISLSLT